MGPLAAYVHFPWCLQKCPYCDFASEAIAPRDLPHQAYADAVLAELAVRREAFARDALGTVFFGGGTPSLWEPRQLGRVLEGIVRAFGAPDEVTVECNPTSLTVERARALKEVGVGRLSIGVQSLRDVHLRYLGRLHDAAEALRAVRDAASVAGLRVSADLMFGMPDQRAEQLVDDARTLLDAGAEHLSCYALTIEPATRFGELARRGRLPRLADDDVATLFEALHDSLTDAGLEHYEVSNYARPGQRARHNEAYWRGQPYVGLGAGAVGCAHARPGEGARYRNVADVARYIAAGSDGTLPPDEREALDGETLVREGLMLGLRTIDGVDLVALAARTGVDPRPSRVRAIARQIARGNVVDGGDTLAIPQPRWLLADEIVSALF